MASGSRQTGVTAPGQPTSGPGGADDLFPSVASATYGNGADKVYVFTPQPSPTAAPLVIFTHGWGAIYPTTYGAWIDHLVRHEGAIVIYPVYQDNLRTPPAEMLPNAVTGIKTALDHLRSGDLAVKPDETHVTYVGHSMGAVLAANLAATAARSGLPTPKAVVADQPGKTWGPQAMQIALADLGQIPAGTLLLAIAGDSDRIVGDTDAKRIFNESTAIPAADKDFVTMVSDSHGTPAILANHQAPVSRMPIGAISVMRPGVQPGPPPGPLDYFGIWKLCDALCDAAWYGKNREYALGGTPQQTYMGEWSDGEPVARLLVKAP